MAAIQRATVYTYNGESFPTLEKAVDHVETLGFNLIKPKLLEAGVKLKDAASIWQFILDNREQFVELLSFELPEKEEN